MKKEKTTVLTETPKAKAYIEKTKDADFESSMSDALKQKNEKGFFFGLLVVVAVFAILLIGALADILSLCFEVNQIFGYVMSGITLIFVIALIVRPICKVLGARFFITDVTNENLKLSKRKNRRALKEVANALVSYNVDPKNKKFHYLSESTVADLQAALSSGDETVLRASLKNAYASDVASCVNGLIFKNAGKVFLTTSVSQNDKIDSVSVLLVNLSLVKQIVGIYGYRPSYAKLFKIYLTVLRNALIAYGLQNVNWFNVFGKFFSGVAKKVPFMDTLVDSAVQGTLNAFLTLLIGYKTKRYLCSDYKKQERLSDYAEGEDVGDEEVQIASALAKEIRKKNKEKMDVAD